jgi:hypothetical protein
MKPSAAGIATAIKLAEVGGGIDPSALPLNWACETAHV